MRSDSAAGLSRGTYTGLTAVWWVSRGESRFWICVVGLAWSRVISRCPAGNNVYMTEFPSGLTRTNTVCSKGQNTGWAANNETDTPSEHARFSGGGDGCVFVV